MKIKRKLRKLNWWNVGWCVVIVVTIMMLLFTPSMNKLANYERALNGYAPGLGGECLLWVIPPYLYSLFQVFLDKNIKY